MIIEMMLSGFLFLFILVLNLVMGAFGYMMEKDDYNPDKDLEKIAKSLKKFKIGIGLALIEHYCVIALTILLFIAFSPYGLLLGIVLFIFRRFHFLLPQIDGLLFDQVVSLFSIGLR